MLIGRRTYEEFASWWPHQDDSVPLAAAHQRASTKYVVTPHADHGSTGATPTVVGGADPVAALVARLRRPTATWPSRQRHGGAGAAGGRAARRGAHHLDPVRARAGPAPLRRRRPTTGLELVEQRSLPHGMQFLAYRTTEAPVRARHVDADGTTTPGDPWRWTATPARPGRRRGGVRSARRPLPARAAPPLLPHARVARRRRGRGAGRARCRRGGARRVRGPLVGAHLAVPHRHATPAWPAGPARPPAAPACWRPRPWPTAWRPAGALTVPVAAGLPRPLLDRWRPASPTRPAA